jgi:hypothetical protein
MLKYFVLLLVILSVKIWSHLEKVVQDFKLLEGHAACNIWVCTRLGWGRACSHPGWLVCCMYNAALIKTISSSFSSGGNSCLGPERSNKFRATAQTTSLSQQLGEMRRKEPEGLLRYLILFLRYPITLDSIARQG